MCEAFSLEIVKTGTALASSVSDEFLWSFRIKDHWSLKGGTLYAEFRQRRKV
jgi:hypothetical protein